MAAEPVGDDLAQGADEPFETKNFEFKAWQEEVEELFFVEFVLHTTTDKPDRTPRRGPQYPGANQDAHRAGIRLLARLGLFLSVRVVIGLVGAVFGSPFDRGDDLGDLQREHREPAKANRDNNREGAGPLGGPA
jgi:hypothetical protein